MNWIFVRYETILHHHAISACDGKKSFSIYRPVQPLDTKGSLEFLVKEKILRGIQAV